MNDTTEPSKGDRDAQFIPPRDSQTPEEVAKIIAYALSELSSDNAHHDFEHLCRHIARRRICSNILPATGPVSSGGDAGADFETLSVYAGSIDSAYWRLASSEKVLFACSLAKNLKKKIASDLEAAAQFPEAVERLYFFYNRPIAVALRNKLKADALSKHGIHLEIVDSKAIAEFLADRELLWIAERYLSLPIELRLPESSSTPSWYQSLLHDPDLAQSVSSDTFYQLKSAIRHATAVPECHSDIPKLIEQLKRFRTHPSKIIARKAFYEEFVAMLRGLNAAEGYESHILDYLAQVEQLTEPDELEEASNILGYASGATARRILSIDFKELATVHEKLLQRINALLPERPSFTRCALLFTRGFVELKDSYITPDNDASLEGLAVSACKSITTWTVLLKEVADVKIFPVERLSSTVNFLFTYIDTDWLSEFVGKLDSLIGERIGAERTAENLRPVALHCSIVSNISARYMHSIRPWILPKARNLKAQRLRFVSSLPSLSTSLGLHHAAKYYALASAFAALSLTDEELRRFAAVGLGVACQADYASGALLLFFLAYEMFVMIALEYKIAGSERYRQEKMGHR